MSPAIHGGADRLHAGGQTSGPIVVLRSLAAAAGQDPLGRDATRVLRLPVRQPYVRGQFSDLIDKKGAEMSYSAFVEARDFLLAHRTDYETAYRDFR